MLRAAERARVRRVLGVESFIVVYLVLGVGFGGSMRMKLE